MRVGVYGGSFNPPHVGHAMVASWLLWTDRVDCVRLVPSFSHPFSKRLAPFADRVRMCRALAGELGSRVLVDEVERDLPQPNYTIDVLGALDALHREDKHRLVVGADVLGQTSAWRSWDQIEARYRPIVVGRAGYPLPPGTICFPGVSSSEVRALLAVGHGVEHLLPAVVLAELPAWYADQGGP
jgi:nicotinate-nucleotide adenylyltransferase